MFEATVQQGTLWRKLVDCITGLVDAVNFDCTPHGMSIQAMDSSHVALVHLLLRSDGFQANSYQCERNRTMGVNLAALSKVLKVVDAGDSLTMRHQDETDVLLLSTENKDRTKRCEYTVKLMEIDGEAVGIPDMEYRSSVTLSSAEFAKIARDMGVFGDTVTVDIDASGVKFTTSGDTGEAMAFLRASGTSDTRLPPSKSVKQEVKPEVKSEVKTEPGVKVEPGAAVKPEPRDDESEDAPIVKKFQVKQEKDAANAPVGVEVNLEEPVTLSFALRFMTIFARGAALSDRVTLQFAPDSPCMIEYEIEGIGSLRYYLAPKVDDEAAQ